MTTVLREVAVAAGVEAGGHYPGLVVSALRPEVPEKRWCRSRGGDLECKIGCEANLHLLEVQIEVQIEARIEVERLL